MDMTLLFDNRYIYYCSNEGKLLSKEVHYLPYSVKLITEAPSGYFLTLNNGTCYSLASLAPGSTKIFLAPTPYISILSHKTTYLGLKKDSYNSIFQIINLKTSECLITTESFRKTNLSSFSLTGNKLTLITTEYLSIPRCYSLVTRNYFISDINGKVKLELESLIEDKRAIYSPYKNYSNDPSILAAKMASLALTV